MKNRFNDMGLEALIAQLQTLDGSYSISKFVPSGGGTGSVNWGDIAGQIENQTDLINYLNALKEELEGQLSKVFTYKGSVSTEGALPRDAEIGDVYNVEDTGANFAYSGEGWDKLSETFDFSQYVTEDKLELYYLKTEVDELLNSAVLLLDTNKANKIDVYTKTEADEKYLTNEDISTLATTEYVDTKISDLVGAAPETLDTLEEIAAKLQDGTIQDQINKLQKDLKGLQTYVDHYLVLTPEQEQQVANTNEIAETLSTAKTVTIENGTVAIINVPEVTSSTTINAPLDDNVSLDLTSAKSVTLNNTGENTVNLNITAPKDGTTPTITLTGNYDTVVVENASVKLTEGTVNNIIVKEDTTKNTTINAKLGTDASIVSESNAQLTVTNQAGDTTNLDLDAPESTVTLNGQYNNVTSTVGENTLIINSGAHIKKLTVEKGNVIVKDRDINNRIDEIINETEYTVEPYVTNATTMSEINSGMQIGGKTIVQNNIEQSGSGIAFGILASGNVELDLNGKTVKGGRSNTGLMFIRGTSNINIIGEGSLENINGTYGIWVSSVDAVVNIYSGDYKATTHCLYAEKGTINVYGGTFKITDEDKKFLLNCYDASYTAGTAKINVYSGKFYGFNPAQSMSEPGGPVSFVAEGYHVEESTEEGITVYTVVKD